MPSMGAAPSSEALQATLERERPVAGASAHVEIVA